MIKTNLRLAQDFSVFSLHHSDLRTNLETLARDLRYRHYKLIIGQIMYGKIKSNEFKLNFFSNGSHIYLLAVNKWGR